MCIRDRIANSLAGFNHSKYPWLEWDESSKAVSYTHLDVYKRQDQKRVLDALGLRKMNRVVEHEATPSILGMVEKVKHLVAICLLYTSRCV